MSKIDKIILLLLILFLIISSFYFFKLIYIYMKENRTYKNLQYIVEKEKDNNKSINKNNEQESYYSNLKMIKKINNDMVAWIKIDGTNINYPVMQKSNYYLHRDIYKKYSFHGTPFLSEYCDLENSSNLIIYAHNMNDNTMFGQLECYKDFNFYLNHKYIKLYILNEENIIENIYEVMTIFKISVSINNDFKYYSYINFRNIYEFKEFSDKLKEVELYNTGIIGNYNDKYVTLSTCEYSQENGRLVIVAKKISQNGGI